MSAGTKMCPNGHVMDATWDRCPYCPQAGGGQAGGRAPVPPTRVGAAMPPPMAPPPPPPPMPHMAPPPPQQPQRGGGGPGGRGGGDHKRTKVFAEEVAEQKKLPVVGWLVCLNGKHKGEDFRIREGKNTIGGDPKCDIVLSDDHVSSKHANINYIAKGDERVFVLVDLDSTNGTFLNDSEEPVYHEELVDNDTISFGTTKCKFKCL